MNRKAMAEGCEWKGYLCYEAGKAATWERNSEFLSEENLPYTLVTLEIGSSFHHSITERCGVHACECNELFR
jgi:hypothetical protein